MKYFFNFGLVLLFFLLAGCSQPVEQQPQKCRCPDEFSPLCGQDGKIYANKCMADCAKITVAYEGECRQEKVKPAGPVETGIPGTVLAGPCSARDCPDGYFCINEENCDNGNCTITGKCVEVSGCGDAYCMLPDENRETCPSDCSGVALEKKCRVLEKQIDALSLEISACNSDADCTVSPGTGYACCGIVHNRNTNLSGLLELVSARDELCGNSVCSCPSVAVDSVKCVGHICAMVFE